jgi:bifunctional DNA-binding transcriptional regulator/antitoxin component of YhaV-PrlF toxin-antitoxin module
MGENLMEPFHSIIDQENKIKIPQKILNTLNWQTGTPVLIDIEDNRITIVSQVDKCVFCGNDTQDLFFNKPLCVTCRGLVLISRKDENDEKNEMGVTSC